MRVRYEKLQKLLNRAPRFQQWGAMQVYHLGSGVIKGEGSAGSGGYRMDGTRAPSL